MSSASQVGGQVVLVSFRRLVVLPQDVGASGCREKEDESPMPAFVHNGREQAPATPLAPRSFH